MKLRRRNLVAGFLLTCCLIIPTLALTPEELVEKLNDNYAKIKDAQAEITLDTSLQLFGCGGVYRQKGMLYYKAPDKLILALNGDRYFFRGNSIRKIDKENKRFYVKLIHAPDFSVGFTPALISHNFYLAQSGQTSNETVLEGRPRPDILKNVKRVIFHIDPQEAILRDMDLTIGKSMKGNISIKYEKINGQNVPVMASGKSALEFGRAGSLIGLLFKLKGDNFKINRGLADSFFDPGF